MLLRLNPFAGGKLHRKVVAADLRPSIGGDNAGLFQKLAQGRFGDCLAGIDRTARRSPIDLTRQRIFRVLVREAEQQHAIQGIKNQPAGGGAGAQLSVRQARPRSQRASGR